MFLKIDIFRYQYIVQQGDIKRYPTYQKKNMLTSLVIDS